MVKRVLITGSNGLLGQKLIDVFKNANRGAEIYQIIASSKGENRKKDIDGYIYEPLDITDREQVLSIANKYQPHVIINTAAMTNVDACEDNKEMCMKLNVEAVKYLVEASEQHNTHLIHLSTDFIFDGEGGPYKEDDEPNPLSYYGKSKLLSEEIVQEAKCPWAIARTIIVYGTADNLSRSNIVLWGRQALLDGGELNIVDDQYRMPTLAEDLAKGCLQMVEHEAQGIYHLCGPDYMSIYEMIVRMAKYYGKPVDNIHRVSSSTLNQKARRPPKTGFDLTKSRGSLGYEPRSFEAGLDVVEKQLTSL